MKVVFFDLETTGTLVNKHGIHQISGMIVIDGEVKETFDFKVQPNPKAEIVQEALDVAGVTKEQILSYPAMGYVYGQFTAILNKYVDKYNKQDKFFLAGYNNASFDNQFLRAWFLQNGDKYFGSYFWSNSIDVMVLATPGTPSIKACPFESSEIMSNSIMSFCPTMILPISFFMAATWS